MQIHLCIIAKEFSIIKDFTKMSLYFDFLYDQKRYNKSPGNHIISGNLPILNYEENNNKKKKNK